MNALVKLTAYLAPKAAALLKEGAIQLWQIFTESILE